MQRNSRCRALVLSTYPVGEMHSTCLLLTPEQGITRAMAYGLRSQHSKLRATVFPFSSGYCTLYAKGEQYTIKAFDLLYGHPGIRQELHRFFYASLWAEIICISHFGVDYCTHVFDLLGEGLALLEQSTPEEGATLNIHFLWHYLKYTGERPDLPNISEERSKVYYNRHTQEFIHGKDVHNAKNAMVMTASSITYLEMGASLPLGDAMQLHCEGVTELNRFLQQLYEYILGRGLKTTAVFSNIKF